MDPLEAKHTIEKWLRLQNPRRKEVRAIKQVLAAYVKYYRISELKCDRCGKIFVTKRSDALYCPACRETVHYVNWKRKVEREK